MAVLMTILVTLLPLTFGNDPPEECKPLWYNKCMINSDCCTNNCHRGDPTWLHGVCMPPPTLQPHLNSTLGQIITSTSSPQEEVSLTIEEQIDSFILQSSQPKHDDMTYTKYVKGLIFTANNFQLQADPLPCTDLDPRKEWAIELPPQNQDQNQSVDAIRLCDLCPHLPLDKLKDIQFTPTHAHSLMNTHHQSEYADCVALCVGDKSCVALNFDFNSAICQHFNSTTGEMVEKSRVTFVVINQPTWLLGNWILSRNTRISPEKQGNEGVVVHKDVEFLDCLASCDRIGLECEHVTYNQKHRECRHFKTNETLTSSETEMQEIVDYEYGHLATFRVNEGSSRTENNGKEAWRFEMSVVKLDDFTLIHDDDFFNFTSDQERKEFDYIDNPGCKLQPMEGCDPVLGKQKCRYPENLNDTQSRLPICPKSRYGRYKVVEEELQLRENCFALCVQTRDCLGVQWNSNSLKEKVNVCHLVNLHTLTQSLRSNFPIKSYYALRTPKPTPSPGPGLGRGPLKLNLSPIWVFNIYPGHKLSPDPNYPKNSNWIREFPATDLETCLNLCVNETECQRVSYDDQLKKCFVAKGATSTSVSAQGQDQGGPDVLFVKRPQVNSPEIIFSLLIQTTIALTSGQGQKIGTFERDIDVQEMSLLTRECLVNCTNFDDNSKSGKECDYVQVEHEVKGGKINFKCTFYSQDNQKAEIILERGKTEVYVKTGKKSLAKSLTQEELDQIPFFQVDHFYSSCFREAGENSYSNLQDRVYDLDDTPTDLSNVSLESNSTVTSVALRRRRGFFSWIKDKIFKPIAKAAKSIVNDIKDTIVNTGQSIAKVFKGDFKGAKEAFLEIPIVRDVKETVESGITLVKGIASGKNVGEALLDFGTNLAGVVPIPGARGVKVIKQMFKPGKAATSKISKESKDKIKPKKETKNDKDKKKKKDEEDRDGEQCPKKRSRRATGAKPGGSSKKRPLNCQDDRTCEYRTKSKSGGSIFIPNMDKKSSSTCSKVNLKANQKKRSCHFLCKAGYSESHRKPVCRETTRSDASWLAEPKCDPSDCGTIDPLDQTTKIVVKVPHPTINEEIACYYIKYDARRKLAIYSATYHDKLNYFNPRGGKFKRSNNFKEHPCPTLNGKQIEVATYKFKSPFIRGHLTPYQAIGMLGKKAGDSSFLMINIAPQETWTNSVPWGNTVEDHSYCFLKNKGPGIVMTGLCPGTLPGSAPNFPKPTCFWKLVCYKEGGTTIVAGYKTPNSQVTSKDQRKKDTMELKSQRQVIDEVTRSGGNLKFSFTKAWIESGAELLKFRTPGVSPLACSRAMDLPAGFSAIWAKKGDKRRKRDTNGGLTFGCSKKELDEFRALISSFSSPSDDEDDNQDKDDDNKDDQNGDDDPGDRGASADTFKSSSCGKRLIGYYPSWGEGKFSYVQGKSLTHAIFAFFETFPDGSLALGTADSAKSIDPGKDKDVATKRLASFLRIGKTFGHLKIMFAVGGWENSQYFSSIAGDAGKRSTFIASTLKIIDQYGFDGIDIDWEHPGTGGAVEGTASDKPNYVTFLRELRTALDGHASKVGRSSKFLISFAGAAGQWSLDPGYDLPQLLQYADWVNVMTYDYFGAWSSKWGAYTGPPAPLFFGNPKGFSGKVNVDWSIKYYVCRSKSPHQITMGVPFYGRYWENVGSPIDPKDDMWRLATAVGGTFKGGFVPYKEIKKNYDTLEFHHKFHPQAKAPYAFSDSRKIFLGYETPESLGHKVKYAEDFNIGGIMIWAIDQDDTDNSMLSTLMKANLCSESDRNKVKHKCPPIDDKRWWTPEDGYDKAGMCGKSAPLYKGFYAMCDPDDPGYSCCGSQGYCGAGPEYCDCPTCVDYRKYPEKLIEEPIRPSGPIRWFLSNDVDGKRGRCGRGAPNLAESGPAICNPDDPNSHCCSNGGYCGTGSKFCDCAQCIDFKKKPGYVYKEKTWWGWGDGKDKSGRCGVNAPQMRGRSPECDPDSDSPCCSSGGWCGGGKNFCECEGCVDFRKR